MQNAILYLPQSLQDLAQFTFIHAGFLVHSPVLDQYWHSLLLLEQTSVRWVTLTVIQKWWTVAKNYVFWCNKYFYYQLHQNNWRLDIYTYKFMRFHNQFILITFILCLKTMLYLEIWKCVCGFQLCRTYNTIYYLLVFPLTVTTM
jgi:hypothetical protein